MIRNYWAGLKTISSTLVEIKCELEDEGYGNLAKRVDDLEYLLGLMKEEKDRTENFVEFLRQENLIRKFESYSEYEGFQISCPHCGKKI